jgi:dihydrofolate reductase
VFVLTHYGHEPIEMEGGTVFHFVDSFDGALATASEVADDLPIDVAGGASTVQQALRAGCLNELVLDIVPILLGRGERLFDDVTPLTAEPVEVATSPVATHIVYRIHPAPKSSGLPHGRSLDHAD